ncbi:uncharacterized protein LOC135717252 [Ochlerotatus camptorhynchus]|uniref:uncharacterized protein LOC135717252 n=1 Tax=Ochlerotatus camptorhynchus TaxID=644619 RepID=UPI0031E2B291
MVATRLATIFFATVVLSSVQLFDAQQQEQPGVAPLPEWIVFSRQTKLDIQILEPSGIQVWTRYKSKYRSFGVELYVNPTRDESHCDLCRNVSSPVDGKFLIQDDKLQVKLGDTIKYRVVKVKAQEIKWSPWKYVFVDKKLFYDSESFCASQCEQSKDIATVRYLERYLENMITDCSLSQISGQLFFPMDQASSFVNNPERFVKTRLYSMDQLRPLVDHVQHCFVSTDGVGFKMRTITEKLKVLEAGRERLGVVDYDEYLIVPGSSAPEARS